MKILHISTYDDGGAGIAANRLHQGLLSAGHESKLLCLNVSNKGSNNVYQFPEFTPAFFRKILNLLKIQQYRKVKREKFLKENPGNYEIYSFMNTDYRIDKHPLVEESDIINLHWVANFLDYKSFFSKINKPVVWTLHDMNPFLGGFHYKMYYDDYYHKFKEIEELQKLKKLQVFKKFKDLHVVTLSKYIKRYSEESELLGRYPHHLIPNGLETVIDEELSPQCCRQIFNIPYETKVILFVSQSLKTNRKGSDILISAINNLKLPFKFILIAIGQDKFKTNLKNIIFLGKIRDQRLMELAYKMADVFILPSREDNLPNTILESLMQGTPVIAFNTGGMTDVINNKNGILLNEPSIESLTEGIEDFFSENNKFQNSEISRETKKLYSTEKQVSSYVRLYKSILNE